MSKDATDYAKVAYALECIQSAHACILGSTLANAGIMSNYLQEAGKALLEIAKRSE